MSARALSPALLIPLALIVGCIAGLRLFAEALASLPILHGALCFLLAGAAVQLADMIIIQGLVRRFGLPKLFHTIIKVLLAFTVIFTMMRMLYAIDLMPLLTTSAVLSFVLGLALQDTLGNFFAGVTINIEKPYRVGDWISTGGVDGKVVEVTWRTTKLLTNDNNFLIVPNSTISKETIVNYSAPDNVSALWIDVDLDYSVEPNRAKAVILESLRQMPNLPRPRDPNVMVRSFAESSITYGVRVWLNDWSLKNPVSSEVRTQLWYALKRAGINIPFPVRNVILQREAGPVPHSSAEALELLRLSPFFGSQAPELLGELAGALVKGTYAADTHLVREGDSGDSLFIISSGKVAVTKEGHHITELGHGALFGEMSLLTGAPRSASVITLCDCVCLELTKAEFARIAERHPRLLEDIGEVITSRQLNTSEALEKARAENGASEGEARTALKGRMLSLMRSFLGVGARKSH